MTTVAAVAADGVVVMAADTLTNVYLRPVTGFRKILRLWFGERRPFVEVLIGFSGADAGLTRLVGQELDTTERPDEDDPQSWADRVAIQLTRLAVEGGMVDDDGRMDATLLLGCHGRLWTVTHMCALLHEDGVAAVGSGEGPAIGALDALLAAGGDPASAVVAAVRIAAARDQGTGGPIQVEALP